MPTIEFTPAMLKSLQIRLQRADIEPQDYPSAEKYVTETGDPEAYHHEHGADIALERLLDACPVCGDTDCERGVGYIGASLIHADKHPEQRAERAREDRRR